MTNYGMSLTQFRTYMPCFTRVYNFMERKGIPTYTESVGEEFCLHIKEETSLTGSTKKLNYRAIRLLNHIMTGLPYTLKFGRTPKEFAYHGEIGIYVKIYSRPGKIPVQSHHHASEEANTEFFLRSNDCKRENT